MKDGFKVVDADRHVLEPSDLFRELFARAISRSGAHRGTQPVAAVH